jgi:hypothetical protein
MEPNLADLLDVAESWPQDAKDKLLRYAEEIAKELDGGNLLSPEEEDGLRRGAEDFEHGRTASSADIAAILNLYR